MHEKINVNHRFYCKDAPKTLDSNGVSWKDRCEACFAATDSNDDAQTCVKDLRTE